MMGKKDACLRSRGCASRFCRAPPGILRSEDATARLSKGAHTGRQSVLPVYLGLVAQNRVQKRAMNLDLSIVADEAKLAELIHEKANP
jgi:hypothetical protein